jgi:hypothetical protein
MPFAVMIVPVYSGAHSCRCNNTRCNDKGITKMATKKTAAKKVTKPAGEKALAQIYKVKKQFEGGVREAFCKAIPKDGASLEAIAKKASLDIRKALGYARWLAANDYLTRVES